MKVGYAEPLATSASPCGSLGRRGGGVPGSLLPPPPLPAEPDAGIGAAPIGNLAEFQGHEGRIRGG